MQPLLHPSTAAQVQSILRKPKAAYIFAGSEGMGRAHAARWLTKMLHCKANPDCGVCHLIDTGAHPDFITLEPQETGNIGIAQAQELLSRLGKSRLETGGQRVALIDGAEGLTIEAQNSLLKTIEEPPADTMVILIASDTAALLETIKSRCETVHFAGLTDTVISEYLEERFGLAKTKADKIAGLSLGAVATACGLAQDTEALRRREDILGLVERIQSASAFDRLVLATKMPEMGVEVSVFIALLARRLRLLLRQEQTSETASKITALERFERQLKANVNGRSAWSRLLLEL